MLTTNDIGNLFESMRTTYGAQWKFGTGSIGVWREALRNYTTEDIRRACNECLTVHVDHPPTLPQFMRLVDPPKDLPVARPNTYLAPPPMQKTQAIANRALLQILRNSFGVDRDTLEKMYRKRNEILEKYKEPSMEFVTEIDEQLTEIAESHDRNKKAEEIKEAVIAFRIRQGMPEVREKVS